MSGEGYIPGDFWRICDSCGFKMRQSRTVKRWDGLIVCRFTCNEERHPQDFVQGIADRQAVTDPRPVPLERMRLDLNGVNITDTFVKIDQLGDHFLDTNEVTKDDL